MIDVATALALGHRDRQEDALAACLSEDGMCGLAVLSDGMGGHDDGDLASRTIVEATTRGFDLSGGGPEPTRARLLDVITEANRALRDQIDAGHGQAGMGGTVIVATILGDRLSWASIGDSALYIFRGHRLLRLNEVHSLAAQIDMMAAQGAIDAETARTHPQRGCLTSALVGGTINRIDCPEAPVALIPNDIVLLASDGLEALPVSDLRDLLERHGRATSQEIADALMAAVVGADLPCQDNTSVIVLRPMVAPAARPVTRPAVSPAPDLGARWHGLRQGLTAFLSGRSAL